MKTPKNSKKTEKIEVRVSYEEKEHLIQAARTKEASLSDFVRAAIIDQRPAEFAVQKPRKPLRLASMLGLASVLSFIALMSTSSFTAMAEDEVFVLLEPQFIDENEESGKKSMVYLTPGKIGEVLFAQGGTLPDGGFEGVQKVIEVELQHGEDDFYLKCEEGVQYINVRVFERIDEGNLARVGEAYTSTCIGVRTEIGVLTPDSTLTEGYLFETAHSPEEFKKKFSLWR